MNDQKANRGKLLAQIGAILQLGPFIGAVGTTIGMMRAFATLEATPGVGDPQQLSASIGNVLVLTAVGLAISAIGLVLLCIALFGCRYRAECFFWFLVIYSGILFFSFPVGPVFAVVFLIFCIKHRQEFLNPHSTGITQL